MQGHHAAGVSPPQSNAAASKIPACLMDTNAQPRVPVILYKAYEHHINGTIQNPVVMGSDRYQKLTKVKPCVSILCTTLISLFLGRHRMHLCD